MIYILLYALGMIICATLFYNQENYRDSINYDAAGVSFCFGLIWPLMLFIFIFSKAIHFLSGRLDRVLEHYERWREGA